jgi:hypothetical protein
MTYTLFIDDLRDPGYELGDNVFVARTNLQAMDIVSDIGLPGVISFDHDLGKNEPITMRFMWWLIDGHLDGTLDLHLVKQIIIHSANPVGAENLRGLWNCFAAEIDSPVRAEIRPATVTHGRGRKPNVR